MEKTHSIVEMSKSALLHNIAMYKKLLPAHCKVAPVIKSNAYGHGMVEVATVLDNSELVDYLCVVSLTEAVTLRSHNITKPLLVLSIIDADLALAIEHEIDLVVYDLVTAVTINTLAQQQNKIAAIHLKIDTGLSRLGIHYEQALSFIVACNQLQHLELKGIFSHFASSERSDLAFAQVQLERFTNLINDVEKLGITIPLKHISCSAALTSLPTTHLTFARFGISTYGLWSSVESKVRAETLIPGFSLQPVLTWKTRVIARKTVPAGSFIGYDCTYQTTGITELALLPIGYFDGYNRQLSNRAQVKIKDQLFPVRGRIAMNLTIVDVTTNPTIAVDDEVTLLGTDSLITAEALAELCSTINYEITTRINPLIARVVVS